MPQIGSPSDTDVLVVVDVQLDFMPGGALAVPQGDAVVAPINHLLDRFRHAVATQDWHPPGHASFASVHAGKQPFDTVMLDYGEQILWPDHCVQASSGAALHPALDLRRIEMVIRKGFRPGIDSYSGFRENDRRTVTGLDGYLKERGFRRVFIAGLARDYCVQYTAMDGLDLGYDVVVLENCCRAIDPVGAETARRALLARGGSSFKLDQLV